MVQRWWVTLVRAWPQENEKSGIVIRVINSSEGDTRDRPFASIDEALDQIRAWLEELEAETSSGSSSGESATRTRRRHDAD